MDAGRQELVGELRRLSAALHAARREHTEAIQRIEVELAHEERRHEHEPQRHAGELARLAGKRRDADRKLAAVKAELDAAQRRLWCDAGAVAIGG